MLRIRNVAETLRHMFPPDWTNPPGNSRTIHKIDKQGDHAEPTSKRFAKSSPFHILGSLPTNPSQDPDPGKFSSAVELPQFRK
ncbi:uncharacterized protein EAE98_011280 [Botrytis deweyae]|uniref:Uncharacterized protein n=1 Tax=Botrytis deweyae TaxID=2478750 RepID=A0ABQ7I6D3_9HELO|nr:uncharacterized protein EAE98_011280 [Botrytis deweyae]KAF7915195.1 hypothetical protein EAE98_011280 [Botrytis deweyae]